MLKRQPVIDTMTTVITRRPILSRNEKTLLNGTNHTYSILPKLVEVDIFSLIVLENGVPMESGYTIDYFKGVITIHRNITDLIDDITIRFRPDPKRYYLYRELLILPVSELIPFEDLDYYAPAFYDLIGIQRVIQYPQNEWARNQLQVAEWGHVINYRLDDIGIIAELKVYE